MQPGALAVPAAAPDCALVASTATHSPDGTLGPPVAGTSPGADPPVPHELGADDRLTDRAILTGRQTAARLFVSFGSL